MNENKWVHIIWRTGNTKTRELIGPVSQATAKSILLGLPQYEDLLSPDRQHRVGPRGYAWRYWVADEDEWAKEEAWRRDHPPTPADGAG